MSRQVYDLMMKLLREGATQREAARAVGVTQTAVSYRVKHGWRDRPSNRRMDPELRRRALALLGAPLTQVEIARRLGISSNTLYWIYRNHREGRR